MEGQGNKLQALSLDVANREPGGLRRHLLAPGIETAPLGPGSFTDLVLQMSEIWLVSGGKQQVSRAEIQGGETGQSLQCKLHAKSFLGRKLASDSQGFRAGTDLEKCRQEGALGRVFPGR